ncbi:hypothetical protein RRG08_020633 [Elysia crispata]|uniref:Uncharacterized protein n=1 Tax=Elysia crispata TaxID=231223 RepID=A0AAE1DWX3_9GAST|nr:hypothetical protein RRG08_020633 [Elysia crispata]
MDYRGTHEGKKLGRRHHYDGLDLLPLPPLEPLQLPNCTGKWERDRAGGRCLSPRVAAFFTYGKPQLDFLVWSSSEETEIFWFYIDKRRNFEA